MKQVSLPFACLPTTDGVRAACANIIRDISLQHDLTDEQLGEKVGVHKNTIGRFRNKQTTMDNVTLARIGAVFGQEALAPWHALGFGGGEDVDSDPMHALALAMAALSAARGPKGRFDALPAAKDAADALSSWIGSVERQRLRVVA
jgi:transcriptional regulator with XRE-family HTH domain